MSPQKNITPVVKHAIIIILLVMIANTLWLNIAYRHELFLMSLGFIADYQHSGNSFTTFVYNVFSLISGTQITVAILVILILFFFRKANTFVLIWYVALNTYIMAIVKLAFADPRPTWYTDQIQQLQWKCEYTYGFPSGHCWIILVLHWLVWCDIVGTGPKNVFLLEPLIFAVFVPLSRLYLGAHSGDHVVNSISFGFAFALLYKYELQKQIFRMFSFLLNCKRRALFFGVVFFLQILMFIPPIVLYEHNTQVNRVGDFFLQRLNTICQESYSVKEFQGRQASQSAIGNAVMGIMYALLLYTEKQFIHQNRRLRVYSYLTGKWNFGQRKIRNFILTMIVYIIPAGIILGIFFALIPHFVQNFYGDYCSMAFAWTTVVVYWLRYVPQIAFRFGLIDEDSPAQSQDNDNQQHKAKLPDTQNQYNGGPFIQTKDKLKSSQI